MTPEETRARLLYRDGLMLVLDKPAGIAVHRGPKGGASLEDDFDALRFGLPRKPALAHRLDRDTAGCLVLGRHHKALEKLGLLFKQGKIRKTYWAVVAGAPEADERRDRPAPRPAGRQARLVDEGRPERAKGADALAGARKRRLARRADRLARARAANRAHPSTARPRASQGWPILGDAIYGAGGDIALQLLARKVVVPLSKANPPIEVEAPAPPHMLEALAACGFAGDARQVGEAVGRRGPAVGRSGSSSKGPHPTAYAATFSRGERSDRPSKRLSCAPAASAAGLGLRKRSVRRTVFVSR